MKTAILCLTGLFLARSAPAAPSEAYRDRVCWDEQTEGDFPKSRPPYLPSRSHPRLGEKAKEIKNVVLLPLRVNVYELSADGISKKIDDWSNQARENIAVAIEKALKDRPGIVMKAFPKESEASGSALKETTALFDAVNSAIVLHIYNPNLQYRFEDKVDHFDYSLGPEIRELKMGDTDAFLLVNASDHIWTGNRKALQTFGLLAGIGAGVATGVYIIPVLGGGGTGLEAVLVDADTGEILWYKPVRPVANDDLRDPGSVRCLIKQLLEDFPAGKR